MIAKHHSVSTIVALDVGVKRIGVAVANLSSRLPRPLTTLDHTETILEQLQQLVTSEHATMLVVGLPRGLEGQHTAQTAYVEAFAAELPQALGVPLHWQDEALTSRKAEDELRERGKPFSKGDIDALSATYILEDFLQDHPEVPHALHRS